ncbi:N-acetylglucosamine kinase [Zhihengliuella flava]|uniref:N-acetylglucosamine kinase-like BadF-type ATPase n=1 Tax=Zhihengliuella flava TaxID=1285193 RepID=A0A931GEX4_9MICC|nr:BadF/BadG/BcrA/BcrD ATPase family protein [Zhihengliuella flava]MBG6084047.1 N-acetylglucosamine kinase-like BadF-type ATPase [Zhihengliuella flava]
MQDAVLAIDGGQTGVRARFASGSGEIFESAGLITHQPLSTQIADVVAHVREASGRPIKTVAAGLSGLVDAEKTAHELLSRTAGAGVEHVVVTHDSVTSYLGALGEAPGVVTASGTGVVTLAVGRERHARVDGWGFSMGDAGSGFWIGRAVLEAVMRAHDGRGPDTALTEVVEAELGDLPTAYIRLQADPRWVSRTAQFAAAAARLAHHDAVARGICEAAAAEVALSIRAAARAAQLTEQPVSVCLLGGVLRPGPVREATLAALAAGATGPDEILVEVRRPAADALAGAARLPALNADSPLRELVCAAG